MIPDVSSSSCHTGFCRFCHLQTIFDSQLLKFPSGCRHGPRSVQRSPDITCRGTSQAFQLLFWHSSMSSWYLGHLHSLASFSSWSPTVMASSESCHAAAQNVFQRAPSWKGITNCKVALFLNMKFSKAWYTGKCNNLKPFKMRNVQLQVLMCRRGAG